MDFYLWEGIGKDHSLLQQAYSQNNYRIIDTDSQSGRCLICFTGNGLYYPNTLDVFEDIVIKRDRYEWANLIKNKKIQDYYQRIILIRDIYKQWYVTGINERCNNAEKLEEKLRELTILDGKSLEISVVGNSAGGYAAVLFGILLGADKVFNFSGQYNLNDEIYRGEKLVAPFLKQYKETAGKYYDLKPIIEKAIEKTHIYYFFPYRCDWDRREYEYVAGIDAIKPFLFTSKYHGITVWGGVEIDILTSDEVKLQTLVNTPSSLYSKFSFARHYHSFGWCVKRGGRQMLKTIKSSFTAIKKRIIK